MSMGEEDGGIGNANRQTDQLGLCAGKWRCLPAIMDYEAEEKENEMKRADKVAADGSAPLGWMKRLCVKLAPLLPPAHRLGSLFTCRIVSVCYSSVPWLQIRKAAGEVAAVARHRRSNDRGISPSFSPSLPVYFHAMAEKIGPEIRNNRDTRARLSGREGQTYASDMLATRRRSQWTAGENRRVPGVDT